MFYKIRFKIIFVKLGLESEQQHFRKSNTVVLILRPDYLFTSQFVSIFFLQIKGQDIFWEWEEKTIPALEARMVDPLAILYMVNCTFCQDKLHVWTSQQAWHQPTPIFMPQDWSLEIVTSCTTSRKALRLNVRLHAIFSHSVRFLNMFANLPATDFVRDR